MGQLVVNGAAMQCTFGLAPSTLIVTPENLTNASKMPAATIMDHIPIKNIAPFGMCQAPTNPAFIAATAAAAGTPTPVPCIPVTTAPWVTGSPTVTIGKKIALNNSSKCMCTWLGVISINMPGQMTVNVP